MAAATNASDVGSGNVGPSGKCCHSTRSGFALRALCGLWLGVCAGCASSSNDAVAISIRDPTPSMTKSLLLKPVDGGRLTSAYGIRYHPFSKRRQVHRGIDWAAPRGSAVRAAGDGVVVAAGRRGSYGHYLRIDHGGTIETAYAHLERYASGLRPGRVVRQGDPIGRVGSSGRATGPHLHYEVLVAGRQIDPLAFAPAVVATAPDPSHATSGGLGSELGIGGPDIDAGPEAGDPAGPDRQDFRSLAPDAIDESAVIWVEDLLSRRDP